MAFSAAALVLFVFTPRLVLWRGMLVTHRLPFPEIHRAFDTLRQLQNLWEPADTPSNAVLAWRLLFPAIWHYGHLPVVAFLAMPFIGCLLSLWLTAWLTFRRLGDWRQTWMVTALVAALPWFFVSTGWLAYFDSWLMLGLLLVAFVRSRVAVCADVHADSLDRRAIRIRAARGGAGAVNRAGPHRESGLAIWRSSSGPGRRTLSGNPRRGVDEGDPGSTAYVQAHWEELKGVSNWRLFEGLWSGARAGWLMIGAAICFAARRIGWKWGGLFAAIVIFTAIGALFIAADMSRTLVIEAPVLLLGAWLWSEAKTPGRGYSAVGGPGGQPDLARPARFVALCDSHSLLLH